jgi:hypothetical protein
MLERPHLPAPSPKFGRRGASFKVPRPNLGEGFRVSADSCRRSNRALEDCRVERHTTPMHTDRRKVISWSLRLSVAGDWERYAF